MGGMKLAAQELGVIDGSFCVESERLEFREPLAKTIDFQCPSGLVGFLAVLRQGRCFAQSVEFVVEACGFGGRSRWRFNGVAGLGEEPVNARDASTRAEAFF